MKRVFTLLFILLYSFSNAWAQRFSCNNPLVGYNYVVDNVDEGILSLLSGGNSFNNLLDQDLTNFTQINLTAVVLGGKIVSVKRVSGSFASGKKVGFVIEVPGSAVTLDLLSGLSLRTYLNNGIQETVSLGGGSGLLKLSLLNSGTTGHKRIEFTTTLPFDEVELIKSSAVEALANIRVYNAYVSDASCNNDCLVTLTTNNYSGATAATNNFLNSTRITDTDLTNYATQASALNLGIVGLSGYIQVNAGVDIQAGSDVGFNIQQPGLLGLISLDLLQDITLTTYNSSDVVQESFNAGNLLDVSLLSGGNGTLVFKTTKAFRKVRLTIGSLGLTPLRVFNAFVRLDTDNDGVPDCLDNCSGNDLLVNGKGEPLACYPDCNLNAGADISECPANSTGSVQLNTAGVGNTWVALAGNPSAATINSSGLVQGMSAPGIYRFRLYNSVCSDTVSVNYRMGSLNMDCNRALVGPNAVIDGQSLAGGLLCLLCGESGAANVVDGNLNNYLQYSQLLNLVNLTSLVAVRDINTVYPAGTRVGYVVSFPDGLLSAGLLNSFQLRTYRNGVLAETATAASLLGAGVLAGNGNKTRLSFVATQPFDRVELLTGNVLGLLETIRIYNAFVEPSSCPTGGSIAQNPQAACYEILTVDSVSVTKINYDKTGFDGAACALCKLDSISHVIDQTYANYATLTLTAGVLQKGSVSVQSKKVFTSGYEAGFAVSADASLLKLDVLSGISIVTYLNGVRQDSINGNSGLLSASLLPGANSVGFVGFRSQKAFNEVRLVVNAPVSANLLSSGLKIYYAFARLDTDGDGVPDCLDKCCSGNDQQDSDGDGAPDACDVNILAANDTAQSIENTPVNIHVLTNDTYGLHGLDTLYITHQPPHGTVTVNNNGTSNNPADDYVVYTPNQGFFGNDTFSYRICDSYHICSDAYVYVRVLEVLKAKNDTVTINEDTPVTVNVLNNDSFGNAGPGTTPVTIVTPPVHGTATVNNNGTPNNPADDRIVYTPNPNFNGTDSLVYRICDATSACQNAVVYFHVTAVNDAPVVHNDTAIVNINNSVSINVLANDNDLADGSGGGLDSNSLSVITQPVHGTVSIHPVTHAITYTPSANFHGLDSFVYQVCDLGYPLPSLCGQATVHVEVREVLSVKNDTVTTNEDTPVTVNVLNNDSFGHEGPGTTPVTITTPPAHGTATVNNNGTPNDPTDDRIVYTPGSNYNGTDSLVYQICDATNTCQTGTVYFNVNAVNDAPVVNNDNAIVNINSSVSVNVLANDNDNADGINGGLDVSSVTVTQQPSHGTVSVNTSTGAITYTPAANFHGLDSFVYQICDLGYPLPALCGQATVHIEVREVLSVKNDTVTMNEDTPVTVNVLNNDSFGHEGPGTTPVTIVTPPAHGTATVNNNGTPNDPTDDRIVYTPGSNYNGTDSLVYQICDATNICQTGTVYFNVNAVNDAPVVNNDNAIVNINSSVSINVLANDNDNADGINGGLNIGSVTVTQQPSHGTVSINVSTGAITYTPAANFHGLDSFVYQVCDVGYPLPSLCGQATVHVEVREVLSVKNDTVTMNEDTPVTVNVLNNDSFGHEGPGTTPVTIVTPPAHGTATVNNNGTPNDPTDDRIAYTPNPNYNGSDSLVYQICDATNTCQTGTVYFNVNAVNDAPVVNNDNAIVNINSSVSVNVLANDNDNADGLNGGLNIGSVTVTQQPSHGTVSVNTITGAITYTPAANFHGLDSFVYQVCDLGYPLPSLCGQATVHIEVREVLSVKNDTVTINEDTPVTVNVLNNDSFGHEGPGSTPITILTPPAHGTATVNNNGTPNDPTDDRIVYTPNPNYNGTDSLVYQICDATSTCQTGTVYFNINAVNDAPVVNNDNAIVNINSSVSINVLANDNDNADGLNGGLNIGSVTVTQQPLHGSVSINVSTGAITYTPNTNFYGLDSFVYQVCDVGYPLPVLCGQATVHIQINDILSVKNDTVIINEDTPVAVNVLNNDSFGHEGPGSTPITILTPPAHGTATVNNNGTPNNPADDRIDYLPGLNYYGTDSLVYQICDGANNCASATVIIYIQAVNDAPVANDDNASLPSGGSIGVNVLANDNDNADAPLGGLDMTTLTILSQPFNGDATVNTFNGQIIYTADPGFFGYDTIVYRICDIGYPLPSKCDTAKLIVRVGEPDLSPNILILPSILQGPSTFYIVIEAHEINNAPTDGSEILLIMPRDPYIQFTYNPALTNVVFFTVNNSHWTYDGSNPNFHIFRTSDVIPPNGQLSFGLEAFFDPKGSSGQKPITISIYQGGGETNYMNNTDVETLIYYGN